MLGGILTFAGCSSTKTPSDVQTQTSTQVSSQVQTAFTDLDAAQAKKIIDTDKDLQIIDVREQFEFSAGHLPNAKLISVSQLESRIGEIDKTKPVLLYCASGARSSGAAQFLARSGYDKIYNLRYGIMRWNYEIVK